MRTIRLATENDIPVLQKLIIESTTELGKGFYTAEEIEAANAYLYGIDTDLINDQTYYVIEIDGKIAGCGGWSKRTKLFGGDQFHVSSDYLDPQKDAAKIRAFFIHPHFSRQGLGTLLLNHCEEAAWLQGFDRFEMMATLPGAALYEQRNYKKYENVTKTLRGDVNLKLIKMMKNLKEFSIVPVITNSIVGFFQPGISDSLDKKSVQGLTPRM